MRKRLKGLEEIWGPREWLEAFGARYGLTTEEYVRRCCRGDVMPGGFKCHLPAGWGAFVLGRSWMITWTGKGRSPEP